MCPKLVFWAISKLIFLSLDQNLLLKNQNDRRFTRNRTLVLKSLYLELLEKYGQKGLAEGSVQIPP